MRSWQDDRYLARNRLPRFLFEYVDGGSYEELTLAANREELSRVRLRQRVLHDVADCDTHTSVLGMESSLPLVLGPVGLAGILSRRGERAAARAAASRNIHFCLSTVSVCDIAEVAEASPAPFWFQLYMVKDRGFMADVLAIASNHCSALVFTVDMPIAATRYRDLRTGLSGPSSRAVTAKRCLQALRRPRWCLDVGLFGRPHSLGNLAPLLGLTAGMKDFTGWIQRNFDPAVTWQVIDFLRQNWSGPIIVKGIADVEDARLAVEHQVDAIVVSNHGGRQLDGTPASCEMLTDIAMRLKNRVPIFVDGGVRSGLDIFRMLALGADSVWVGRAWAYALAAEGQSGVGNMIDRLAIELAAAMSMTGCRTVADIDSAKLI